MSEEFVEFDTVEEAKDYVRQLVIDHTGRTFCPLIKDNCRQDCASFTYPRPVKDKHRQLSSPPIIKWRVVKDGECGCVSPIITGSLLIDQ